MKFVKDNQNIYFAMMNSKESFLFRAFNKLLNGNPRKARCEKMSEQKKLSMLNALQCEAHRELFISGLREDSM